MYKKSGCTAQRLGQTRKQQTACVCARLGAPRRREWAPLMSGRPGRGTAKCSHSSGSLWASFHMWMLRTNGALGWMGQHGALETSIDSCACPEPSQAKVRRSSVTKRGPDRDGMPRRCLAEVQAAAVPATACDARKSQTAGESSVPEDIGPHVPSQMTARWLVGSLPPRRLTGRRVSLMGSSSGHSDMGPGLVGAGGRCQAQQGLCGRGMVEPGQGQPVGEREKWRLTSIGGNVGSVFLCNGRWRQAPQLVLLPRAPPPLSLLPHSHSVCPLG
jgi:hypothetical protein